ncbi:MAG: universal stress protein [Knoellia sp.]
MNTNELARPVVVGYDSSRDGDAAFEWARQEAERRDAPLALLVARGVMYAAAPGLGATPPWPEGITGELVQEARDYAAKRASAARVRVDSSLGSPAAVLVDASVHADLVVVGRHPHTAVGEAFWGSTSTQVVAHASCPVVVVDRPIPDNSAAPIVVAVDGSDAGRAALEFAFRRAATTGSPLVCVHAWWVDVPGHLMVAYMNDDMIAKIESEARAVLDESLAPWIEKFPDVVVRKVLHRRYAVPAVLAEAGDSQLIVVGSRGHGGFAGLLLGSVSQELLHSSDRPCPLAVVHAKD